MRRCFTISICRKCGQRRYVQLNSVINGGVWSHNDRSLWERPNACWRSSPLPAPVVKNQELSTASPTTRKEQYPGKSLRRKFSSSRIRQTSSGKNGTTSRTLHHEPVKTTRAIGSMEWLAEQNKSV